MENQIIPLPLIYTRISEVMAAVEAIGKDRKNVQQGYSFRGIDDMYNALNEHLSKAKIFFTSDVLTKEREERVTKNGGNVIYTVLTIKWTIYAEDGSNVSTITVGEAMDSGDKSANKAMSASYKYALMQVFCIPTNDEKDTEAQTHEVAPKTQPSAVKAATGGNEPRCAKCGAGMAKSKTTGKDYCSAKCWLTPVPMPAQPVAPLTPEEEYLAQIASDLSSG